MLSLQHLSTKTFSRRNRMMLAGSISTGMAEPCRADTCLVNQHGRLEDDSLAYWPGVAPSGPSRRSRSNYRVRRRDAVTETLGLYLELFNVAL